MINAHVHNLLIHKGSQWVVFDPTVQHDPQSPHVFAIDVYKRQIEGSINVFELNI